jgi:hypothetical protein
MIKDLIKIFEQRKEQLRGALLTRKEQLDVAKQHQMYGAAMELEMVIRTMQYHHNQWLQQQQGVTQLSRETQAEVDQRFNNQLDKLRQQPFRRISQEEFEQR